MRPYETIIATAVKIHRSLKGYGEQTKFTKYLESIEYKSEDEIKAIQAIEMCRLLNHTVDNIPYYSYLKGKLKLETDTVYDDINEFPVLTKEILINKFDVLTDKKSPYLKKYRSGGTSKKTTYILRDKEEEIHSADEYFNRMAGVYPGSSRLLIRRAESVYFANNPTDVVYSGNRISRTYIISPAFMDNKRLELLSSTYLKRKPKIIMGITYPVYRFAAYILETGKKTFPVEAILLIGQTMMPKYRKTIERAFKTDKIYDLYGATEFGMLAQECDRSEGLHYIPAIHYIEVVDEKNNAVEAGVMGQFLVTNLRKRAMPLIRYKIDDLATLSIEKCSCGRGFPLIKRFEGRRIEAVVSPKDTYMTPVPFYRIMEEFKNVEDFLIEQRSETTITIQLKMKKGVFSDIQKLALRKAVYQHLDYPMKVEYEYIDTIEVLPNGKVMRIKSYENYISKK